MPVTFDVRVWSIETYQGKRRPTYRVLWKVYGRRWKESFSGYKLAESFRSDLLAAVARGEGFDTDTGRPVSMKRAMLDCSWYSHACAFADMKWPNVAPNSRRTHAEALTALTMNLLVGDRGHPDAKLLRSALTRWGFNTIRRDDDGCPADIRAALSWVERHTHSMRDFDQPAVVRAALNGLTRRLDGQPMSAVVVSRRKRIFNTVMEYAVERDVVSANIIPTLKWRVPRPTHVVDKRRVVNPLQARTLLEAVRRQSNGPRLVAYFGCIYYAAMRPEEVSALLKSNLALPERGWGELHLDRAESHAGREWTDSGTNRQRRQLKQRELDDSRSVPCPPELTALLHEHLKIFGTSPDGHLFVGERNKIEMPKQTVNRTWQAARRETFTSEVEATSLGRTPYDLRHAAVSTLLNAGVPPTVVAEIAGQSVEVLLKIYAKCLSGGREALRRTWDRALGRQNVGTNMERTAIHRRIPP